MSREELLAAVTRLAQAGEIYTIDVDRIVAEARSTREEYLHEFSSEDALLEALHGYHVSTLVTEVGKVMETLPVGRLRMERTIEAFWAGCIERIPVRRLIKRGRGKVTLDAAVQRKNRAFEYLLQPELKAMGDPSPPNTARLLRAMIEEVAQAEFEMGERQPLLRAALWRMLDGEVAAKPQTV
jgi:AcrR family transcriptional regulator